MLYRDAKKLHNEDEVIVKSTGVTMQVLEIVIHEKERAVELTLEDGNSYWHNEVE